MRDTNLEGWFTTEIEGVTTVTRGHTQYEKQADGTLVPIGEIGSNGQRQPTVLASDVVPERIEWLWEGYVPLGMTTVLGGFPGVGKSSAMSQQRRCLACKVPIPPQLGAGRPRKYCTTCLPPVPGAVGSAAWRAVNPERVAAYNDGRRRESKHVRS